MEEGHIDSRGSKMVVPWVHSVCTECFQKNPHAVWLIKLRCFQPGARGHGRTQTLVSIEPSVMRLVEMRHPPLNIEKEPRPISRCEAQRCQKGNSCPFPHSDVEYQTWEFVRNAFKDERLKTLLLSSQLVPMSPSMEVCATCYQEAAQFNNTQWLTWLDCAQLPGHEDEEGVILLVGNNNQVQDVIVLPQCLEACYPHQIRQCEKVLWRDGCPDGYDCTRAHCEEERQFWKWSCVESHLEKVPNFCELWDRFSYSPDEVILSASQVGLDEKLISVNYTDKLHKLICLDEIAHCKKMALLCNGKVTVERGYSYNKEMIVIRGMDGAAMDYAIHGHAIAHIPLPLAQSSIDCVVSHRDQDDYCLFTHLPNDPCPPLPRGKVYVHFEINHNYFDGLHKAVNCINPSVIRKLFPSKRLLTQAITGKRLSPSERQAIKEFTLDNEYQMTALEGMISSDPRVPFLVIGPFGTGKTRILAAAASALLCDKESHILICTYQHQCADSIYQILYHKYKSDVVRVVPNRKVANMSRADGVKLFAEISVSEMVRKRVVIITFLTATNLKQMEAKSRTQLHFSHILIDEGAQAREPESLGALAVVKEDTKIVIVGDHKQSGPRGAVLSELAQKNELGTSLLERLFNLYKSKGRGVIMKNHTAPLLTNYRCHSSILAFTSSLFYQHTLLSRSSSETHPLAPFPLLFTCSSIDKDHKNLPNQDIYEARVLMNQVERFVNQWPKSTTKQEIGVLASTRKQAEILRQELRKRRLFQNKFLRVEVKPTFLIQGYEFDAVFLSTIEPTDGQGKPHDPVRSMSHELVFNTIMTRAKSLIYCVGNPFTLCQIGDQYPVNCWKAYLQRCVQCETLQFSLPKATAASKSQIETAANEIQSLVFPHSIIDEATTVQVNEKTDRIISQYIRELNHRREYKTGCKLVRRPEGDVDWLGDAENTGDNVVLCRLQYSFYNKAKAVPLDPSKPAIPIEGHSNLKGSLHGDTVRVDMDGKCVLFDEDTEQAIRKTRFGTSFLCRVSEFNCIQFYPLDKRYPKFVNLPTISREEKMGVVCFDPSSLDDSPKVSNVIPHQVALRMAFVVKFLGWKKECGYPLGIIVGAFPSKSPYFQPIMFKRQHHIPGPIKNYAIEKVDEGSANQRQHFPLAITIDPEGSADHDDALTCTVKERGGKKTYTVGVHITDLQCMVRKGSELDEQAKKRGCTVYNAPDSICSPMFPDSVLEAASIQPGKKLTSFSVLIDFDVKNEGRTSESISLVNVHILESCVTSEAELTYKEAQDLLRADERSFTESLRGKMEKYNSHTPAFHLQQLVQHLWKFAWFLRKERLKDAAMAYTVREVDQLKNPEAHYLVEELMIRANMQVARRLSRDLQNQTILRSQKPPDETKLEQFKKHYKMVLPLSATCKVLNPPLPPTVSPLTMLKSQHSMLVENLRKKKLVDVKHCVQMEHLHPQLLALQSRLRSLPASAEYCVLKRGDRDGGSHSDLQCSHYTNFTSPLRRYIDVIIQRQLHGVLVCGPNVYTPEELVLASGETQNLLKQAKNYERDVEAARFTKILKEGQQVYDCIISDIDVKKQTLSLCFTDVELRLSPKASEISTQHLQKNHSTRRQTPGSAATISYKWKVKMCSVKHKPATFLDQRQVEISSQRKNAAQEESELSFFCSFDESNCLDKKTVSAKTKSSLVTVPHKTWLMMQRCVMDGTDCLEQHREQILKELPPVEGNATPIPHRDWRAILLVYTLSRELKLFDVMKAQLCAAQLKRGLMQEPAIQLLEVGPGVRICVQHNKDPEKCFVGNLLQQASNESYDSIPEYIKCWEPLIISESALTSVKESEFLLVRDVVLEWPEFQLYTSSSGESYYTMTENSDRDKNGVKLSLDSQFLNTSFNFFKMSEGDLVCIRLSSSEGDTRYVFHMVINNIERIEKPEKKAEVFMKFVQRDSNYISSEVHTLITNQSPQYEFQLIQSSVPQRRIYRSLKGMSRGTELAKSIAVGNRKNSQPRPSGGKMNDELTPEEMKVAVSYWPLRDKRKLNDFQKRAIELAWNNEFTMIQGPPGTGKSVTGAHIAYALAMRLSKESTAKQEEQMCVMYCGPSQQSVNVVLDIFLELLNHPTPTRKNINVIRVFSKGVEKVDFRGAELDSDAFVHITPSAKCETTHQPYSLHYIIRKENSDMEKWEERFASLHRIGKIPSFDDITTYRTIKSEAEESVLKSGVNIILCTCNEAASHRITNTVEPKYCIIDECAMATEPECMVPIRRAQHVVLIGDHQQLQPVIHSREAEKMGLGKSLFERYANKEYRIHLLRRQYRMHPAICEFPSKAFYGGELETAESVRKRQSGLNLDRFWPSGEQCPIVFCQVEGEEETGHIGSRGHNKVDSQSKYNTTEAKKIVDIAEKLVCQYKVPHSSLAVLTPYSAQKEAIKDELKHRVEQQRRKRQEEKRLEEQIQVKTITESQGSEYGIVLLSTVRSQRMAGEESEAADIDWIRKNLGFVADPHRICVGITRSKFGLVIVGNENVLKYDPVWKKLIKHYKAKGCFRKGENFPS